MRKAALTTLALTAGTSALLGLLRLVGLVSGIGGGLVHLFLVLGLLCGFLGGAVGITLLIVSGFTSKDDGRQQPPPTL